MNATDAAERIGWACQAAKRQQHITARFTDDPPTAWDRCHAEINQLLDELTQTPQPAG